MSDKRILYAQFIGRNELYIYFISALFEIIDHASVVASR